MTSSLPQGTAYDGSDEHSGYPPVGEEGGNNDVFQSCERSGLISKLREECLISKLHREYPLSLR